jgi:uncharacterized protein (DUF1778 family)
MRKKASQRWSQIDLSFDENSMRVLERAAAMTNTTVPQFVLAVALERSEEIIRAREAEPERAAR